MSTPLVSVVMPVYNAERYAQEAVDSILTQTFTDFEFVMIDDGSIDGSSEILRRAAASDCRVRLRIQRNAGITPSLNEGIAMSRGKYVARMDADDVAEPRRLERQVEFLEANPQIVAVGTQIDRMDPEGALLCRSSFPLGHAEIEAALLGQREDRWPMAHPTVTIRTDMLRAVGGYDEQFLAGEDRDLWLRLAERGRLANLHEMLLRYRCRPDSISYKTAHIQQSMSRRAIELACRRRGIEMPVHMPAADHAPTAAADYRYRWAKWAANAGHYETAWKHLWPLLRRNPLSWRTIKVAIKASPLSASRRQPLVAR